MVNGDKVVGATTRRHEGLFSRDTLPGDGLRRSCQLEPARQLVDVEPLEMAHDDRSLCRRRREFFVRGVQVGPGRRIGGPLVAILEDVGVGDPAEQRRGAPVVVVEFGCLLDDGGEWLSGERSTRPLREAVVVDDVRVDGEHVLDSRQRPLDHTDEGRPGGK